MDWTLEVVVDHDLAMGQGHRVIRPAPSGAPSGPNLLRCTSVALALPLPYWIPVAVDLDRVLDSRPAWVNRSRERLHARIADDALLRRRALSLTVLLWQLGEWIAPRRQVAPIRRVLLAMVVLDSVATYVWIRTGIAIEGNPLVAGAMAALGDGPALALRTVWSGVLVIALTALAERRASVRPALALVLLALGAVTLIHMFALGHLWSTLLARP